MISYHFLWDLVYLYNADIPWYKSHGAHIWQQSICWTFILLAGFSWHLGKKHMKLYDSSAAYPASYEVSVQRFLLLWISW